MGVHYPTESTQPSQEVSIILPILQVSNVEAQRDEITYPKSRSWEWQSLGEAWVDSRTQSPDFYPIFSLSVKFNPFVLQMRKPRQSYSRDPKGSAHARG